MSFNRHLILDRDSLLTALKAVGAGEPLSSSHPLFSFFIVRDQIEKMHDAEGEHVELHAVREVLLDCFQNVLGDRVDAPEQEDDTETEDDLELTTTNPYQQAYSFLYYRYMRPDLGLNAKELAQLTKLASRTLSRRQQDGLTYLVDDLMQREINFRREQRQRLMKLHIPYRDVQALYNRRLLVEQAVETIRRQPVLLVGLPGMGKTQLASVIAHRLLSELENLVWINLLPGVSVQSQIKEAVSGSQPIDLRVFLSSHPILLVLENLQPQQVNEINTELFNLCWIVGTATSYLTTWQGVTFEIPPLSPDDTIAFCEANAGTISEHIIPDEVIETAHGIPGIMLEYLKARRFLPSSVAATQTRLYQHFADIWTHLSTHHQMVWFMMRFLPMLEIEHLLLFFGIKADELMQLNTHYILVMEEQANGVYYRLSPQAHEFITLQMARLQMPLDALVQQPRHIEDLRYNYVWLQLLINHFLPYLGTYKSALLTNLSARIPKLGLWAHWKAALDQIASELKNDPYWKIWLDLEQSRIQRWQGLFVNEQQTLVAISQQAGQLGYFDLYARALLELSIALLYRGEWQEAISAAVDAEQAFARLGEDELVYQARHIRAQALLYFDPVAAVRLIEDEIGHDPTATMIAAEAALQQRKFIDGSHFASQALHLLEDPDVHRGRALNLLAMALWHHKEMEMAMNYQQQAINLFDAHDDLVGLARALNNMGVIYASGEKKKAEAQEMWQQAFEILLRLQDTAALEIVRYNMKNTSTGQLL